MSKYSTKSGQNTIIQINEEQIKDHLGEMVWCILFEERDFFDSLARMSKFFAHVSYPKILW